ncbi:hypothetical protein D3C72_1307960 [compost metagenome]
MVAPEGTITTRLLLVAETIDATMPLNRTVLLAGVAEKLTPERVTVLPTQVPAGVKP